MEEYIRQLLTNFNDSFNDFKERLIRIEENVKNVGHLREDVDTLKQEHRDILASTKSAHKRLDTIDRNEEAKKSEMKWLRRAVITGFIGFFFTVLAGIILAVVKGWI